MELVFPVVGQRGILTSDSVLCLVSVMLCLYYTLFTPSYKKLILWNRFHLISRLFKKFLALHGIQRLIAVCTGTLSSPYPEPDEANLCPPILFLKDPFYYNPDLRICLPIDLIPADFPTKTVYAFLFSSMVVLTRSK
jgi:hypothetical protein